jgi:hypothetical protein
MPVTPIIISYPLSGFSAGFWLSLDALGLGLAGDCRLCLSGGFWGNCEADNLWEQGWQSVVDNVWLGVESVLLSLAVY